jgi:FKBP-type peptidyl-prolyl cis-trans isomerase FkpA
MNKFKYYFILLLAGISLVSCNKSDDDDTVVVPLNDYTVQYKADNDSIVKYLNTNYITVTNSPGTPEDQDVTITKITNPATQPSIMSYLNSATFPKLLTRDVYNDDITYKVYYLVLRQGTGEVAPMNTDRIYATYKGNLLNGTVFDSSYNVPGIWDLDGLGARGVFVDGWKEIFPKFNIGTSTTAANGVQTYDNFGAGVMFLPSGLAYYASATATIPAYSPLVFSFKLYDLTRTDHDQDGVYDFQEDINKDGYLYDFSDTVKYPSPPVNLVDDTDGDGVADFLDIDDDGDGYSTRFELTKPTGATYSGVSKYYPYDPILDNPKTPNTDESEIWGIPRRPTGALADPTKPESITNSRAFLPADYTDPTRLRMHVDKTYPYQKN